MTAHRTLLPLETARRLSREAVDAIDGDVWVLPDISESLEPQFAWICVSLRVPHDANGPSQTHRSLQAARAIRESFSVLTLLAACKGFGLQENAAFWSDVLSDRPPNGSVPSWARGNWSERRIRPRPRSTVRHPRFQFIASERGAPAVTNSASSAAYLLAVLEMLVSVTGLEQQSQTPAFGEALRALRPWVIRERLPQKIECGVEVRDHDADRACRLLRACAVRPGSTLGGAATAPDEAFAVPPVCGEDLLLDAALRRATTSAHWSEPTREDAVPRTIGGSIFADRGEEATSARPADTRRAPSTTMGDSPR